MLPSFCAQDLELVSIQKVMEDLGALYACDAKVRQGLRNVCIVDAKVTSKYDKSIKENGGNSDTFARLVNIYAAIPIRLHV